MNKAQTRYSRDQKPSAEDLIPSPIQKRFKNAYLTIPEIRDTNFRKDKMVADNHFKNYSLKMNKTSSTPLLFSRCRNKYPCHPSMIIKRSYNSSNNYQLFFNFPTFKSTLSPQNRFNTADPFTFQNWRPSDALRKQRKSTQSQKYTDKDFYSGSEESQQEGRNDSKQRLSPFINDSFIFPSDINSVGIMQSSVFNTIMNQDNFNNNAKENKAEPMSQPSTTLQTLNYVSESNLSGIFEFIHRRDRYGFISSGQLKKQIFFHLDDLVGHNLSMAQQAKDSKSILIFDCLSYISQGWRREKAVNIRIIKY